MWEQRWNEIRKRESGQKIREGEKWGRREEEQIGKEVRMKVRGNGSRGR